MAEGNGSHEHRIVGRVKFPQERAEDHAYPGIAKHDDGHIPEARRILEVWARPLSNMWAVRIGMPRVA